MNDIPLMDEPAQRGYIDAMLSNPDIFARTQHLLSPTFFDPHLAKGVKFMQEYWQENRTVAPRPVFKLATRIDANDLPLVLREDIDWMTKQIAEFCRFKAVIEQVQKAVGQGGYLEKGDLGTMVAKLKLATEMGIVSDLGIDYFENVEERLESYEKEDAPISTGWTTVDDVIGGGVGRQELVLFLAPSGGGKSVGMLNLAHNFMRQGLSGVYISLEMKDKKVTMRTDQMLARMASGMISLNKTQVAHEIHKFHEETGVKFFVKRMRESTTNANDVAAYIRELKVQRAFRPDWIVVDYIDIMAPVQKGAGESLFLKDKFVSEEVRALGYDENAIMISGSQLGKHATEKILAGEQVHQGDIQGGSSKTNTSDLQISMEKTEQMHQAGIYRFGFPKARNSDATGKTIEMGWDKVSLRISDKVAAAGATKLDFKPRRASMQMEEVKPGQKLDINSIMNRPRKDASPEA